MAETVAPGIRQPEEDLKIDVPEKARSSSSSEWASEGSQRKSDKVQIKIDTPQVETSKPSGDLELTRTPQQLKEIRRKNSINELKEYIKRDLTKTSS
jgi:hypothetical protein